MMSELDRCLLRRECQTKIRLVLAIDSALAAANPGVALAGGQPTARHTEPTSGGICVK
jgi:hypothetical protein